jgi:hypothetical protein
MILYSLTEPATIQIATPLDCRKHIASFQITEPVPLLDLLSTVHVCLRIYIGEAKPNLRLT